MTRHRRPAPTPGPRVADLDEELTTKETTPKETTVRRWAAQRLPSDLVHLDVAGCGRLSTGAFDAEVAHLLAEASGGYVAEADALATTDAGKAALAGLLGLAGTDVAYVESGATAFAVLLAGWPLARGARVGSAASEYGGNAMVLRLLAEQRGWTLVDLPVDGLGRITDVPGGLDLVTFAQVASQRGIAQPVKDVLRSGVPLLLDVAQSLGQTDVPPGAAAYVGTSRKWLCGPRGVGFCVVDPAWEVQLTGPPSLSTSVCQDIRRFEAPEAHVAGRVALSVAVLEWSPELLPVVLARASQVRQLMTGAGLSVVEPVDEPTGITTATVPGDDVVGTRAALLAEGIVTSAVPISRAADLKRPVLRLSTAAWVTEEHLVKLAKALARRTH